MHGSEPVTDRDLLESTRRELTESERTVAGLCETGSNLRNTIEWPNQALKDSEHWASIVTTERNQSQSDFRKEQEANKFTWRIYWFLFVAALLEAIIIFIQFLG